MSISNLPADAVNKAEVILAVSSTGKVTILKDRHGDVDEAQVTLTRRVVSRQTRTYETSTERPLNLASDAEVQKAKVIPLRRKVAVSVADREELLWWCISTWTQVRISGTKLSGERYYDRLVQPVAINSRRTYGRAELYLFCRDVKSAGERQFVLSGIDRVEVAS